MVTHYALVTGAGSGIGRALTIELSRGGVAVIAVGRRESALRETARLATGKVHPVAADVGADADYAKISRTFPSDGATLKYLIHAAGICPVERITDISPQSWRRTMATNVHGRLLLTLHLLPWLKPGSRVLLVGSNSATTPRKGLTAYCVSKAASFMLQECLKLELSEKGVLVSSAIPSPVYTPLLANQMNAGTDVFPDGAEYRLLRDAGRLIFPATVARFYHWLLTTAADNDYPSQQWNILDASHHPFWLGGDSLFAGTYEDLLD
jgi:benzil reductase ((S)-benzoin forming)